MFRQGQAPKPQSAGMEDEYDYPEQVRAQSGYYEDLNKNTTNTNQEYQSLKITGSKAGQSQSAYQNISSLRARNAKRKSQIRSISMTCQKLM